MRKYKYNYSLILPYRDKYDLFLKAVDSVPDRNDIQIIIVDNAPQPLLKADVPVKQNALVTYTTSSPIKGAGCARNVGLKKVEGRFIIFLDADDYFIPKAFESFDNYLDQDFDIVYFKANSINLMNGQQCGRHKVINHLVTTFLEGNNEDVLRYQFVNPIAKMFQSEFVLKKGFQFDEIKVSNDVWFSIMTGHAARRITADNAVVYMISAGDNGTSLTRRMTKENWFIRFQVMVRVNKFLKSVGKYQYRIRLIGALRIAWRDFGIREVFHLLNYACANKVSIF